MERGWNVEIAKPCCCNIEEAIGSSSTISALRTSLVRFGGPAEVSGLPPRHI